MKNTCSTGSNDIFNPTFISMSSYPPHLVHFLFMNEIYVLQGQITWRSKSLGSHHLKEKFSFPMLALCLPKRSWSSCSIIIWLFFEPDLARFLEPLLDRFREAVLATPVPTGATGATGATAAGRTGGGKERTAGRDVRLATAVVVLLLGFATFAAFGAFLGAAFLATFFCFEVQV